MAKRKDKTANILGTDYVVHFATEEEDPGLKGLNGYCLTIGKKIVIESHPEPDTINDTVEKRTLRHELLHAFLYESGLDNEAPWADCEEQLVDWIAIQFPKMVKVMKETNAL